MPDDGNLIGCRRLSDQRRICPASRTLQVLKNHNRDLRAFGRTQRRIDRVLRGNQRSQANYSQRKLNQSLCHNRITSRCYLWSRRHPSSATPQLSQT